MSAEPLSALDLGLAATLVLALGALSWRLELGLSRSLLISAVRAGVQLFLIGLVLKVLFTTLEPLWVALMAVFMLSVSGYEVFARQQRRFVGVSGWGIGTVSMFISSFSVCLLALTVMINADPWYHPRYAIPVLGMLLGNTMSGVAIGMGLLTESLSRERRVVEGKLLLGLSVADATREYRRKALHTALIPIVNTMAAAGVVSLPGMMTGQILAGSDPLEAVKYQLLILFLIAGGTGFGSLVAIELATRRLFDERQRLRLDRLYER
ncbi:MAG: ABC transporter permease [Gammaproteobacteria bacterium]